MALFDLIQNMVKNPEKCCLFAALFSFQTYFDCQKERIPNSSRLLRIAFNFLHFGKIAEKQKGFVSMNGTPRSHAEVINQSFKRQSKYRTAINLAIVLEAWSSRQSHLCLETLRTSISVNAVGK